MADIWQKLMWRLQAVANDNQPKSNGYSNCHRTQDDGLAIIVIDLLYDDGQLIGWCKPQHILIEPRILDHSRLNLSEVKGWDSTLNYLKDKRREMLVVKAGRPVGFMREVISERIV